MRVPHPCSTTRILCQTETDQEADEWVEAIQGSNSKLMNAVLRNTIDDRRQSILGLLKDDLKEIENIAQESRRRVKTLSELPGNTVCADCGGPGT